MDKEYRALLEKQQYRIYRDHSAVKMCHWLKESLIHGRSCYKQDFYGIRSHRCLHTSAFSAGGSKVKISRSGSGPSRRRCSTPS